MQQIHFWSQRCTGIHEKDHKDVLTENDCISPHFAINITSSQRGLETWSATCFVDSWHCQVQVAVPCLQGQQLCGFCFFGLWGRVLLRGAGPVATIHYRKTDDPRNGFTIWFRATSSNFLELSRCFRRALPEDGSILDFRSGSNMGFQERGVSFKSREATLATSFMPVPWERWSFFSQRPWRWEHFLKWGVPRNGSNMMLKWM